MDSTTPNPNQTPQVINPAILDDHQKDVIRKSLVDSARKLLGIQYKFGAEWENHSALPTELDCSEMVEGVYVINGLKMPDGAQNQLEFTLPTGNPQPGDLCFFGRSANVKQIYHVGMIFDSHNVIEARGLQPESSFETGKVILRPRVAWENYKSFVGYRAHPKLV